MSLLWTLTWTWCWILLPCLLILALEKTSTIVDSDGATLPATTLWKVDQGSTQKIKHMSLVKSFFYEEDPQDTELPKSVYRLDKFLHFGAFGGFDFSPAFRSDSYGCGVHSMKAYHTFKHPYYHRDNHSNRHTAQLSAYDMWMCGDKAKNYFKFINRDTKEAADKTFGGRLELTVSFRKALENQEELMRTMISAFEHTTVQPTLELCTLLRNRANALSEVASNVSWQDRDRFAAKQLSLVAFLAWCGTGLLSRPDTFSIWRGISSYAEESSCTSSDLLLVPYALKYNSNGHLGLSVALSQSDLRAIYHKDYNAVSSPPRRVPANATPSRVTHLLEVSFGFVDSTLSVPGDVDSLFDAPVVPNTQDLEPTAPAMLDPVASLFDLSFFDFSISTSGNFGLVISAFHTHGVSSDFVKVLVKVWLHDMVNRNSLVHGRPDILDMIDDVFHNGGEERLSHPRRTDTLFRDSSYYLLCKYDVKNRGTISSSHMKHFFHANDVGSRLDTLQSVLSTRYFMQTPSLRAYRCIVTWLREDSARSPLVGVLQENLSRHLNSYEFLPKLRPERLEALVTRRGSMIHIYSKQLTLDL